MTSFLVIRDKIRRVLNDYETWVQIAAKFVGMMFVFTYIAQALNYYSVFSKPMVSVFLSLICSIIPGGFGVLIAAAVVSVEMLKLSIVLGALTVAVMIIIYLMFLVFSPEQSIVILAVPVLMHYNLHFMVPVLAGMFLTPYAVVPAALGVFVVKFLHYAIGAVSLTGTGMSIELDNITTAMSSIFKQSIGDKDTWVYLIVAAVTVAVIFVIKQFSFDYALYIAIVAGGVAEIVSVFLCISVFTTDISVVSALTGTVIGTLLSLLLEFFKCPLDYRRKEKVQFEDDDYYYYVKAIPKYSTDAQASETVKKADIKKAAEEAVQN